MKKLLFTLLSLLVLIAFPAMAFAQGGGSYSGDDPYDPAAGGLGALPMTMQPAQPAPTLTNKAVMGKFLELFTTGAWDQFDQVIASDCVLHYPGGVDVVGLDAMVAGWQEFFPKLKDLQFTAQGQAGEGDLLMEFITFEATYEGDFMGQQITGTPIKYNQVEMQRFEDGKIVEWWVENDRLWMAEQLGMELVPAASTQASTFPTGLLFVSDDPDWTMRYLDDGTYIVYLEGIEEIGGKWRSEGDVIYLGDDWCFDEDTMPASYQWQFDGNSLTFLAREDTCSRKNRLVGGPWSIVDEE
ncbi:MAG: ester cyclase [Chloroflexi bacterium]|nr:ester cyclase [Chloroflexota bacterium]